MKEPLSLQNARRELKEIYYPNLLHDSEKDLDLYRKMQIVAERLSAPLRYIMSGEDNERLIRELKEDVRQRSTADGIAEEKVGTVTIQTSPAGRTHTYRCIARGICNRDEPCTVRIYEPPKLTQMHQCKHYDIIVPYASGWCKSEKG